MDVCALDYESFRTLMMEAEAVVNFRTLSTDILSDPESPTP